MAMDGAEIRKNILEVLEHYMKHGSGSARPKDILKEVGKRLGADRNQKLQQPILTYWYDLFRSGQLAWGYTLENSEPPWCHLTERGRETLKQLSRDPMNPEGYMEYLKTASLSPIASSYVEEALNTYQASCYKATAVMIGAAAERLILDLADELEKRLQAIGKKPPKGLSDWRVNTVFDSVTKALEDHKAGMEVKLAESFTAYWPAFVQQIRAVRNEAGHPSSIAPVTPELVHAALLTFPELAKLTARLKAWIATANF